MRCGHGSVWTCGICLLACALVAEKMTAPASFPGQYRLRFGRHCLGWGEFALFCRLHTRDYKPSHAPVSAFISIHRILPPSNLALLPCACIRFFLVQKTTRKTLGEVAACCVILLRRISDDRFLFTGHLEGIGVRNFIQPLILKVECSSTTSAWRSPRVLSGFLASTPHTSQGDCTLWPNFRPKFSSQHNSVSSSTLMLPCFTVVVIYKGSALL